MDTLKSDIEGDLFTSSFLSLRDQCTKHKGQLLQFVSLDPKEECVFKCVYCISQKQSEFPQIPIHQIRTADNSTVFPNFPVNDSKLTEELNNFMLDPPNNRVLKQTIEAYFKELQVTFLGKLEAIREKMLQKSEIIYDLSNAITEVYQKTSEKNKLKEIISDESKPIAFKSKEIKELCAVVASRESENKLEIQQTLEKLKIFQRTIDFDTPNEMKSSLLNELDQINMFLFEEMDERQKPEENIKKLMELVNNKLNGISSEQSERFESQLSSIQFAFSKIKVPEIGPVGLILQEITNDQTLFVSQIVEDLAKNQLQMERNDLNEDNYQLNAKEIVKLVSNQTNFCSKEYIQDISKIFTSFEKSLSLFSVRQPKIQNEQQNSFINLKEKQLLSLARLAKRINEITDEHPDQFLSCQKPVESVQKNSAFIRKMIAFEQFNSTSQQRENLVNNIDQIFVDFPIFELLPQIKFFKQIPILFSHSEYARSSSLVMIQHQRQLKIKDSSSYGPHGQVMTDILDNQNGYLMRIKLPNVICMLSSNYYIGLHPNTKKDSHQVLFQSNECGFCSLQNTGATEVLRGGRITSQQLRSTINSLEFRWCVADQSFIYSDPSFRNINKVAGNLIIPNESYRFGIYMYNPNVNISDIVITEFAIIDRNEVNRFE